MSANLFANSKRTGESSSSRLSQGERVSRAILRMEACLQAKLSDGERRAYFDFLMEMNPDVLAEAVENVVRGFRPERTRLPLPAEFLSFCPATTAKRREQLAGMERQWREEFERQNADGSVDRAREEFLHQFKRLFGLGGLSG